MVWDFLWVQNKIDCHFWVLLLEYYSNNLTMMLFNYQNECNKLIQKHSWSIVDMLANKYGFDSREALMYINGDLNVVQSPGVIRPTTLLTEDTGKIFEMAICLVYGIPYQGNYKYSMDLAHKLQLRLSKLLDLFPMCSHTAKNGARYDFTSLADNTRHLSAKSSKGKVGKVAPQVIGQAMPKYFCEIIGINFTTIPHLKQYIQTNIVDILPILINYTFDCPNIYYNLSKDAILFISLNIQILWHNYHFIWTQNHLQWKNSSTLKLLHLGSYFTLLEWQFHSKNRFNMTIRWNYDNLILFFKHAFSIIHI